MEHRGQGGQWGAMLEKMTGFPSPDKIMGELQRLNNNIEAVTPDLHKIAASIDGLTASDVKTLTSKLNDLTTLLNKFYTKIWGR